MMAIKEAAHKAAETTAETTDGEALYWRGPSLVENALPTPAEFRAWYLAIPEARQLEVAAKMQERADRALQCWIGNHAGQIGLLQARIDQLTHHRCLVCGEPGVAPPDGGYRAGMTEQSPEGQPTTEVSVETPAKDETNVQVDAAAAVEEPGGQPATATETHVQVDTQ